MSRELVIVDDREPESAALRLADFGLTVVMSHLPAGDYQFFPHGLSVIIERKCVHPNTRVLRGDLVWVPAFSLKPGDEVWSVEETARGKGGKRGWSISRVVHNSVQVMDACAVVLDDGTTLYCSVDHPWLAYAQRSRKPGQWSRSQIGLSWVRSDQLRPGMNLPRYLIPWSEDESANAAYLAGALDGEGSVVFCHSRPVWGLAFHQSPNSMLNKVRAILVKMHIPFRESSRITSSGKPLISLYIRGGAHTTLSLLGQTRPMRLIDDLKRKWTGRPSSIRTASRPKVVRVRHLGSLPMCAIEVEGGTYMAEGFAAHNTISNLLTSMSDRQLVGQAHKIIETADIGFLLREGPFRRSPAGAVEYFSPRDPRATHDGWVLSGWSWDSFQGMMIDLELLGMKFLDCPTVGEYPVEIARLVTNLCKDEHRWIRERQRPEVLDKDGMPLVDKQWRNVIWSLSAHDGISTDTSEALLREWKNLYGVYDAAVNKTDELAKTNVAKEGKKHRSFGKIRAARLKEEALEEWLV